MSRHVSHTLIVKTAISIPDQLFRQADCVAKKMRVSRSQLYAQAISAYLASYSTGFTTAQLNEVYASTQANVDRQLQRKQTSTDSSSASSWTCSSDRSGEDWIRSYF